MIDFLIDHSRVCRSLFIIKIYGFAVFTFDLFLPNMSSLHAAHAAEHQESECYNDLKQSHLIADECLKSLVFLWHCLIVVVIEPPNIAKDTNSQKVIKFK